MSLSVRFVVSWFSWPLTRALFTILVQHGNHGDLSDTAAQGQLVIRRQSNDKFRHFFSYFMPLIQNQYILQKKLKFILDFIYLRTSWEL